MILILFAATALALLDGGTTTDKLLTFTTLTATFTLIGWAL